MNRISEKNLQISSRPAANTIFILISFAGQKDERGRNNHDAAHTSDYTLHMSRKVKVSGNEVYAAVGWNDDRYKYCVRACFNDGKLVVREIPKSSSWAILLDDICYLSLFNSSDRNPKNSKPTIDQASPCAFLIPPSPYTGLMNPRQSSRHTKSYHPPETLESEGLPCEDLHKHSNLPISSPTANSPKQITHS